MRARKLLFGMVAVALLAGGGCAKKSGTASGGFDLNKTVEQVKAEAANMDASQLTAAAKACKDAFEAKKADMAKLTEQIKNIPIADKMGAEAQKLAGEAKTIQDSMAKIQAQLAVYLDKLKEMKADTSGLQVE